MAQNDTNRRSAIDARTTRHSGYDVSQRVRKRIEEIFGWGKDVGPIRKTKFRGKDRVGFQLLLTLAGYNLMATDLKSTPSERSLRYRLVLSMPTRLASLPTLPSHSTSCCCK